MINTPVTITGRIVSDSVYVERKDNMDGVLKIRVATSRSYKQGEKWHNADKLFINVEAWGRLGINSHISLKPGVSVIVQGFLYTNQWEVPSTDPNTEKPERRQEIRMRATSIGIDLNNYIVGFQEVKPNSSNTPEGVPMPNTSTDNYPDPDAKGSAQVRSDETGNDSGEKQELAMSGAKAEPNF